MEFVHADAPDLRGKNNPDPSFICLSVSLYYSTDNFALAFFPMSSGGQNLLSCMARWSRSDKEVNPDVTYTYYNTSNKDQDLPACLPARIDA